MKKKPKCQQLHAHAFKAQKSLRHEGIIQIQTQKINLQAQTTTDSAQHIMVLRLTFRPVSQIIQLFSRTGGCWKVVHTHHSSKGPMRKPQRGFTHCRGNHRGRSWGQPGPNKTFWESHQGKEVHGKFILFDRKPSGFSTRYFSPKLPPGLETLSKWHPPQDGSKHGRGVFQQQGKDNPPVLMGKERLPTPIQHTVLQSCHILK